ncbi:MAG: sulfatase [Bacteroidota bacterium]
MTALLSPNRHYYLLIVGVLSISFYSCKPERPNLILIIADDMAWDDYGAYGHPTIRTPYLDTLAQQGIRFDQALLTISSCSPSRASIITGKYPHSTDAEQLHWPLPADQITFVEKLRAAGYWTGQAGKWHLGEAIKDRFDKVMDVSTSGFQLPSGGKAMVQQENESGCEDWINILNARSKDTPFFLWLAALDPHRDYKPNSIAQPHTSTDVIVPPYLPDTPEVRKDLALYYDEISRLDAFVGELLQELDRQGIAENTLILFISDNGRPFPRDKTTLYDSGIKTPWVIRWPGQVVPGSVCQSLVSSLDIAPTFLKLAGLKPDQPFQGKDFSPLLSQPSQPIQEFIYAEDHWHDFEDYTRAVRTEQFKYIRNFYEDLPNTPSADILRSSTFQVMKQLREVDSLNTAQLACFVSPRPSEELYDVEQDPYELTNLAGNSEYAEILDDMRKKMEQVRQQTQDRLPTQRTPDEFDRDTGQPNEYRIRPRPSKAEMQKVISPTNLM